MAILWTNTDPEPSSPAQQEQIYNALDVCITLEVLQAIRPQLDEITSATYDFAFQLQAPLLEMMLRGVLIDQEAVAQLKETYNVQHSQLQTTLDEFLVDGLGVRTINPGSWQDKRWLLYEVLSLPHVRKRGAITTDRGALEKCATYFHAEPICNAIMGLQDIRKKLGLISC